MEDDPSKTGDIHRLRMQAASMAVFQPFAQAYFNKSYNKINKNDLRKLQGRFVVESLSDIKTKSIAWDRFELVVGSGYGAALYVAGGDLGKKKIRDLLYRKNDLMPEGWEGDPVPYWGILSAWKLVQMAQFPEDPENREERVQLFRAIRNVHDYLAGELPLSTMTASKICTSPEDVDKLVEYCEVTGEAVFDFETRPELPGLTKSKDLLKHNTEFHLSQPTMLSVAFQPGSAWLVPMFHHESPFDIGKDDVLKLVRAHELEPVKDDEGNYLPPALEPSNEAEREYLYLNGEPARRYNGTPIPYTDLNAEYIDALFDNWEYAVATEINNVLTDLIFPKLVKLFKSPTIRNTAHNYKFDRKIVRRWLEVRHMNGRQDDTMMMVHSNREDVEKGLKVVAPKYWPEFYGYGEDVDYASGDLWSLGHYACVDTDLTYRVRIMEERKLLTDPLSYRVYRSLEVPKLRILSDIEYIGMPINLAYLEAARREVDELIEQVHAELLELPTVRRYIHVTRKVQLADELDKLQARLDKFTNRKLADLDKQRDTRLAKTQTDAIKKQLGEIKAKRYKVQTRQYHKESYPFKQGRETYQTWKRLNTGEDVVNYELSFRSPTQMGDLIYTSASGYRNEMPIVSRKITNPETRRKETIVEKYPTTNKDELSKLPDPEGFLQKLLEYRLLVLIRDTYLQGIKDRLDAGLRVHCQYPTVRSQRLSSRNPNLQNIPSRTKLERVQDMVAHVKRMFIPDAPGKSFFQVDLSQAELRWAAYLWDIPSLIQAYREGKDVHVMAACMSKDKPYEWFAEFAKEDPKAAKYLRFQAKAYNFGLIYGMSAESFREYCLVQYEVEMTIEEATAIRTMFLEKLHSAIPAAHEVWKNKGRKDGFVRTAYGSKRHVPYINSRNSENRSHDERVCLNSPVQGSSGQGLVFSMIVFSDWMTATDLDGDVINTVHDSINGYVEDDDRDDYLYWMLEACNTPPNRAYFGFDLNDKLPMLSDAEAGENWKDLDELEHLALLRI